MHMGAYHKTRCFSTFTASYLLVTPYISKPSLLSWVGFKPQPLLKIFGIYPRSLSDFLTFILLSFFIAHTGPARVIFFLLCTEEPRSLTGRYAREAGPP